MVVLRSRGFEENIERWREECLLDEVFFAGLGAGFGVGFGVFIEVALVVEGPGDDVAGGEDLGGDQRAGGGGGEDFEAIGGHALGPVYEGGVGAGGFDLHVIGGDEMFEHLAFFAGGIFGHEQVERAGGHFKAGVFREAGVFDLHLAGEKGVADVAFVGIAGVGDGEEIDIDEFVPGDDEGRGVGGGVRVHIFLGDFHGAGAGEEDFIFASGRS